MDKRTVQAIVQRYRSPYTAIGRAFLRALKLQPRPALPHVERRKAGLSRRDIRECMEQEHGVPL